MILNDKINFQGGEILASLIGMDAKLKLKEVIKMTKWILVKWTIDKTDAKAEADKLAIIHGSQSVKIEFSTKHKMPAYQVWLRQIGVDIPDGLKKYL